MSDIIEVFYQVCFFDRKPLMFPMSPEIPREMYISSQSDSDGWIEWEPLRWSDGVDAEFELLEQAAGLTFPNLYKLWHSRYYILDGDLSVVRLPRILPNAPFSYLHSLIFDSWNPSRITGKGLLPFGDEAMMDAGPLCFDTRVDRTDANWPIVFWDHEWVGTKDEISPVIFSNFEKLLECCIYYWSNISDTNRRDVITKFAEIDPEGAGGPGRRYWSHWLYDYDDEV